MDKCAKAFVAMHSKWELYSKRFEDIMVAKLFRQHNEDMALYLLRIQPQLYVEATTILKGKGTDLPNPMKSRWTSISGKRKNLMVLRAHLAKPHNCVETIPLEGTSCYNLPLKFSLPLSPSAALPSFVTSQTNPEPPLTIVFPSALPKLSLPPKAPAPLPVIPMPEPHPYQAVHLPVPAISP